VILAHIRDRHDPTRIPRGQSSLPGVIHVAPAPDVQHAPRVVRPGVARGAFGRMPVRTMQAADPIPDGQTVCTHAAILDQRLTEKVTGWGLTVLGTSRYVGRVITPIKVVRRSAADIIANRTPSSRLS